MSTIKTDNLKSVDGDYSFSVEDVVTHKLPFNKDMQYPEGSLGAAVKEGNGDSELREELESSDFKKGISIVNRSIQTVKKISDLRLLDKNSKSTFANVLGYNQPSDGGGGNYILDKNDSTTPDNNGSVIVAEDGGRWKLIFNSTLDIRQFGATQGKDISTILNIACSELYKKGGGTIEINQNYVASSTILMYPFVHIKGLGLGKNSRIDCTFSGVLFKTYKPENYLPSLIHSTEVSGITLVGMGIGQGVCFDIKDCGYSSFHHNEVANFGVCFDWNRGSTEQNLGQSYFNEIYQNLIKPCGIAHRFAGAANRNTISTNSYSDCLVAYDFSSNTNWSETNTFITENVEGCHSWAEWNSSVYSQTWINICIENPSTNGYTCLVKDPGRQVFVNLSLIPLGNNDAITKYDLFPGSTSMILGSAASSGDNRIGFVIPEVLRLKNIIQHEKFHGSYVYTGTIPANSFVNFNLSVEGVLLNDRIEAFALRNLGGCSVQAFSTGNGSISVNLINGTNNPVTLNSVEISCIAKRCA